MRRKFSTHIIDEQIFKRGLTGVSVPSKNVVPSKNGVVLTLLTFYVEYWKQRSTRVLGEARVSGAMGWADIIQCNKTLLDHDRFLIMVYRLIR